MIKCRESTKMVILFLVMIAATFFYSKKIDSTLRTNKSVPPEIRKALKKPAARKNPPSKVLIITLGAMTALFTLRRLTTSYELTPSNLIMKHGILQRRTDPVEMVKVSDFTTITNPIMGIFGLSSIVVNCPKDDSHKRIKMRYLSSATVALIEEHLYKHATSTVTELIKAKESEKAQRTSDIRTRKSAVDNQGGDGVKSSNLMNSFALSSDSDPEDAS